MVALLPGIVACVPVAIVGPVAPIPGSERRACTQCQIECWITPATLEMVTAQGRFTLMCVNCAELELAKSGHTIAVMEPSHQQREEFFKATGEVL